MRGRVPVVPRFQSQHDEPTDSRLLSGSRCVVFSILYRSITPDVMLSPSLYGRVREGRRGDARSVEKISTAKRPVRASPAGFDREIP
jgi:hypothetical protein